jgi:hypothetical protein
LASVAARQALGRSLKRFIEAAAHGTERMPIYGADQEDSSSRVFAGEYRES